MKYQPFQTNRIFLEHITNNNRSQHVEIAPKVKSLSGIIIKNKSSDLKSVYKDHLVKKYSN